MSKPKEPISEAQLDAVSGGYDTDWGPNADKYKWNTTFENRKPQPPAPHKPKKSSK